MRPIEWVTTDEELRAVCDRWMAQPVIAIDTEFMRTNTYYPIPALIQVFDGERNFLLDPTTITDFQPLETVLTNPELTKVLHACSEDVEVFTHLLKVVPSAMVDTQIAAAFCGYGFSMGYARLVKTLLDIELPKEVTRSDWLQRPLSEAQTVYAASDVEYLYRVYHLLKTELEQAGRFDWLREESDRLVMQVVKMQSPEVAWLKFKAAWRLKPRNLALLQALACWREATAQQRNLPRNRVVDNKSLFSIAELAPKHIAKLRDIETMPDAAIRRHGAKVIELVHEAKTLEDSDLPAELARPPGKSEQSDIKALKAVLDKKARELNLAPELLATRKTIETIYCEGETALRSAEDGLNGWRAQVLGPVLKEHYESHH